VLGLRRLARHAVVAAVLLVCAGGAAAALLRQSRDLDEPITSVALNGRVHARVFLPAGYDDLPHRRYPVVYFLHGLPAGSGSYRNNAWLAEALARVGPAILVLPQGARDSDKDPEYLNWGAGRNWETYIASEVPRYIDAHFRTIPTRAGRAIIGLSAGGYGATIVGLHNPGTFSVIESWSGYFHPTDPSGTRALAREPATSAHTLIDRLRTGRTYFAFYVGRGDHRFLAENLQLDRELTAVHAPHLFEVYKGAHETSLWQAHAVPWLRLALERLAPATR
jgi:S-formylglutathione hydrolase FrmB